MTRYIWIQRSLVCVSSVTMTALQYYVMYHFIISIINLTSDVLRSMLLGCCRLYDDIRRSLDRQKL